MIFRTPFYHDFHEATRRQRLQNSAMGSSHGADEYCVQADVSIDFCRHMHIKEIRESHQLQLLLSSEVSLMNHLRPLKLKF